MSTEEICDNCKFYWVYGTDTKGECRDMSIWPKVYGNSMWCGEFIHKDSKEVSP